MALESAIQGAIIKYLKTQGEAENVHGDAYSAGRPDINACYKGRLLRIEVKTPDHGNEPTVLQKENLKRWAKAGAICFVAYSVAEVKAVVNPDGLLCDKWQGCLQCPVKKEFCFTYACRL